MYRTIIFFFELEWIIFDVGDGMNVFLRLVVTLHLGQVSTIQSP
jgi:hypothetical protein